jgi:branched-chain amino acid transport system ATP-binding protein
MERDKIMVPLLELSQVTKNFGGLCAVNQFDLKLFRGELLGLIGPNGAGKTTIFNMISGVLNLSSGDIFFKEQKITGKKTYQINRMGICRTFQLRTIFDDLTVLENVMIGGYTRKGLGLGFLNSFVGTSKKKVLKESALEKIEEVGLADHKDEIAKNLPHGFQQAMALAIALVTEPEVLLLDEPVSGMTVKEIVWMMDLVNSLRASQKRGILLIEHNMKAVMDYCDKISVINFGNKVAEGVPAEIRQNQDVIAAYLGGKSHAA